MLTSLYEARVTRQESAAALRAELRLDVLDVSDAAFGALAGRARYVEPVASGGCLSCGCAPSACSSGCGCDCGCCPDPYRLPAVTETMRREV